MQQSLSKSNSFVMPVGELPNFFVQAFTLANMVDCSIDWLELRTDGHHACYG